MVFTASEIHCVFAFLALICDNDVNMYMEGRFER